jgi:hypothetical protein
MGEIMERQSKTVDPQWKAPFKCRVWYIRGPFVFVGTQTDPLKVDEPVVVLKDGYVRSSGGDIKFEEIV